MMRQHVSRYLSARELRAAPTSWSATIEAAFAELERQLVDKVNHAVQSTRIAIEECDGGVVLYVFESMPS